LTAGKHDILDVLGRDRQRGREVAANTLVLADDKLIVLDRDRAPQ